MAPKSRSNDERSYRLLARDSPIALVHLMQGKVVSASPAFYDLLGYPASGKSDLPILDFVAAEDRKEAGSFFLSVPERSRSASFRFKKSRAKKTIDCIVTLAPSDKGGAIGTITPHHTECQAGTINERFVALADQSPNMIFINVRGRVVFANDLATTLMEYSKEELYHESFNFLDLIAPEYREMTLNNFQRHSKGQEVDPYEYKLLTKSKKTIDAYITTKLITYGGEAAILGIVTDISSLKRSQRELQESQELLQRLFDTMTSSFSFYQAIERKGKLNDFIIYDVNNAFEKLIGKEKHHLIGERASDILRLLGDGNSRILRLYQESASAKKTIKETDRIGTRWLDIAIFPLGHGKIGVVFDDITDQKQQATSLALNEEKYRSVIEQSSDGIILADEEGAIIDWNQALEKMTDIPRSDAIGSKVWDIQYTCLDPALRNRDLKIHLEKRFFAIMSGKETHSLHTIQERELYLKNKKRRIFEEKLFVIETGKLRALGGILKDVTERREAANALKESEEKYRLIVENQSDVIVKTDTKGILMFVSPTFCRMFGKEEHELLGKSLIELISPKREAKGSLISFPIIEQQTMTSKGWRWLEWVNNPVTDPAGNVVGMICAGRDITDKKAMEAEKRRLENQLRRYARQLETKVRNLQRSAINFSIKEKSVFAGIAAYPTHGDDCIGKRVGVTRSTVTSIRNRLQQKGFYSSVYILNPHSLRFQVLGIVKGTFPLSMTRQKAKDTLNKAGFIFSALQDTTFFGVLLSSDLAEMHISLAKLGIADSREDIDSFVIQLPIALSETRRFFDFSPLLSSALGIDMTIHQSPTQTTDIRLTQNMRDIASAMITSPEESIIDLAKRLRLTRTTVSSARRKLIDSKTLIRRIVPDLRKLGFGIISLLIGKNGYVSDAPLAQTILLIKGPSETVRIDVFMTFAERMHAARKINAKNTPVKQTDIVIKDAVSKLDFQHAARNVFR